MLSPFVYYYVFRDTNLPSYDSGLTSRCSWTAKTNLRPELAIHLSGCCMTTHFMLAHMEVPHGCRLPFVTTMGFTIPTSPAMTPNFTSRCGWTAKKTLPAQDIQITHSSRSHSRSCWPLCEARSAALGNMRSLAIGASCVLASHQNQVSCVLSKLSLVP